MNNYGEEKPRGRCGRAKEKKGRRRLKGLVGFQKQVFSLTFINSVASMERMGRYDFVYGAIRAFSSSRSPKKTL